MLCVATDIIIYNILISVTEEHIKWKPTEPSSEIAAYIST